MRGDSGPSGQIPPPLIALSANSAWNIVNFRRSLVAALRSKGYRIVALVPRGVGIEALQALGVEVVIVPMSPRGSSPIADAFLMLRYYAQLRRLRPLAFLGFTAKPNIYGGIAASALNIPLVSNITGLGTGFLSGKLLEGVVSDLYRRALHKAAVIFFHNPDDLELFVARNLVDQRRARLIPGSGIDLANFAVTPMPHDAAPRFLFIGRLLVDKGVVEFAEAAILVRNALPDAAFVVVGGWSQHPRAVPRNRLDDWEANGLLQLVGEVQDVRPFIASADCVVLPSYREGLPRALLEASAMARPIIGADVPGSRQIVEHGVTGFLCKARSAPALAEAMLKMAELSSDEREAMGRRARQRAEEQFDEQRVSNAYMTALDSIVQHNADRAAKEI